LYGHSQVVREKMNQAGKRLRPESPHFLSRRAIASGLATAFMLLLGSVAIAHGIGGSDAEFVAETRGPDPFPFMYLGAKHMVTGYDHLLYLVGVIFFLFRLRQVALFVSLFSLGHSLTLIAGVFFDIQVNSHIVDAIIGLSVVYKAFENLDGFRTLAGVQPSPRAAVFMFGLVHGFGLATKLQALELRPEGLLANLVSFNVGVEIGQILALSFILLAMSLLRRARCFGRIALATNILLMLAGFVLAGEQAAAYLFEETAS
jgi:hypothetical protein